MSYRVIGHEQVTRWALRHAHEPAVVLLVAEWVRSALPEDPLRSSFPSMTHAAVGAASTWVPGTDVVVTFVVFDDERKVRIISVQDVPR